MGLPCTALACSLQKSLPPAFPGTDTHDSMMKMSGSHRFSAVMASFFDITTFFWVPADKWVIPALGHRAQRDDYGSDLKLVYISISCP